MDRVLEGVFVRLLINIDVFDDEQNPGAAST